MKVGIIGGNGVAATNRLCDMVERKITASGAFRDAHHPEMSVWQATPVPSRSMFLEGRGPDWRPEYVRIAKTLKGLGCDFGCMCCNTAHYALGEIEESSRLPFVNLLGEVALKARGTGNGKFELFCSDGARKFDLYGKAFRTVFPGTGIVYPSEDRQRLVTKVICDVKNRKRFLPPGDADSPHRLLVQLIEQADCPVILGCTDLRVAFEPGEELPEAVAVDSLEALADAIVKRFQEDKLAHEAG